MWIKIATDPLGNPLVPAISLGEHGVAFANYAIEVPDDWLGSLDKHMQKYFEIVKAEDVTDHEVEAMEHNRKRTADMKQKAKESDRERRARRAARLAAEKAALEEV